MMDIAGQSCLQTFESPLSLITRTMECEEAAKLPQNIYFLLIKGQTHVRLSLCFALLRMNEFHQKSDSRYERYERDSGEYTKALWTKRPNSWSNCSAVVEIDFLKSRLNKKSNNRCTETAEIWISSRGNCSSELFSGFFLRQAFKSLNFFCI